ncbi:MAG: gliding motility-associated ABC transporter permease subunit GldF [Bacteroidetes bacterium]|jgi:ABC-2 type transport system permease protein|nr:gliding motility-associated ABC transporter permease subunit GldF [Bacteroidota bacterium]
MISILRKEIRSFLSSLIAIIVIVVFLIANGLFLWVFKETNILDQGYANIDPLFELAPILFIFLISAITMRSFSEEKKNGTFETLTTKPVTDLSIILGKYFAGLIIVVFSILPTLIYYYTVDRLAFPAGNVDTGAMWGSYMGLLMLSAGYVSIGMFASVITDNQIVSFIVSMFLCFFFYSIFEYLSSFDFLKNSEFYIEWLGINHHYRNISRGIVDTRDIIYFLSLIVFFIWLTKIIFNSRKW